MSAFAIEARVLALPLETLLFASVPSRAESLRA